jgi:5'-nucleotidase
MMSRRHFLAAGAAIGAAASLPRPLLAGAETSPKPDSALRLTILHTNDVHSHLEPMPSGEFEGMGGAPGRSQFIKAMRARNRNVLLLDAGDMFQGTPYFNLFTGEAELEVMNAMGYDAGTIGNHEFDAGVERLGEVIAKHARFPILNCNYGLDNTPLKGLTREYHVMEKEGLRIGLLGVGIALKGLVPDRWIGETEYRDPIANARRVAQVLRNDERCDFIIALSHISIDGAERGTQPGDRILIREVPEINLIIGGHNHFLLPAPEASWRGKEEGMGYVAQAGWGGTHIGILEFDVYSRGKRELSAARVAALQATA